MSKADHPDRDEKRLPESKVAARVRKATCQKCGACEPKPALNAVCELRSFHPWVGRCFNGVFVKGDQVAARGTRVGKRSNV